jgi:uncharacterized protein
MFIILVCVTAGLFAGVLSGLIGLGGGIIILPVLIYVLGMEQHLAQGTTLAMLLPPVGVLAVWTYYKSGYVDFKVAMIICAGFVLGAFFGSKLAISVDAKYLKFICGMIFVVIGVKMAFFKD